MKCYRPLLSAVVVTVASGLAAAAPASDERTPPISRGLAVKAMAELPVSEVPAIDREALLAEDKALEGSGPGPFRFAELAELKLSAADNGVWEDLPDGGRLWRLRLAAANATDLSVGFSRFRLPEGASLHLVSEADGFFQGPYTAAKNRDHGELWTAVVPGDRAVVELYVPAEAAFEPELEVGWVGRGYRDLFKRSQVKGDQGSCNIDVVCPEGDEWRDEIRSVGRYSYVRSPYQYLCTGSLIEDVPGSQTPYFLTAWHCDVDQSVDQSVVVYWNLESPTCGQLSGGSLSQNQSGTIFRASREDADFALLELEDLPSQSFNVFYSGWDARGTTQPQGSVCIHHPRGDEKAISFNDDPLTTVSSVNIYDAATGAVVGTVTSPWRVNDWEQGTTEGGSSGSGLWDIDSHRIVGTLSAGAASCDNPGGADYYGKLSRAWDGADSSVRLKDWLDPQNTGTMFVGGSDGGGGGNGSGDGQNVSSCGNAFYDDGTAEGTAWFNGGRAGDPDFMFAVKFLLDDFGYTPGNTQITKFCASNQNAWTGGPWPNQVFIYPDVNDVPDESTVLGQGTIYTGDGLGWYEVTLDSPVTLDGDFWLVSRGDPRWEDEDFNMDFDDTSPASQSALSDTGINGLGVVTNRNYMLRATLQQGGGGGGGYGDGPYNYHVGAIVRSSGVGGAFFRTKLGVLNLSGSTATLTLTYFWNNGPTTVTRSLAGGRLQTWDDAVQTLFGLTQNSSGSVLVNSTQPLIVTTRTYTSDNVGTFGSFMPGVEVGDGVGNGQIGILSQLTGNSSFRTNVGVVNLTDSSCQARVRVKSTSGTNLGSPRTLTLGAYKFTQINDVFGSLGTGQQNDAYVTVEALTSGCRVWAYGSVIDGTNASPGTNDPTLIPLTVVD